MARLALHSGKAHDGAHGIMFEANKLLARGYSKLALDLYTKILYEVCPGHIGAFLNRALAYVVLGYPELGVVDAYRAATIAHDMWFSYVSNIGHLKKDSKDLTLLKTIQKYVESEIRHVQNMDPWTFAPDCYTGLGWLESSLASIVLSSEQDTRTKADIPWIGFELRAVYRMCGALWQCGGGALSDALGMISDVQAKGRYPLMTPDEKECFNKLGDLILDDVSNRLLVDSTNTKAQMKMKITLVNKVIYPWNSHEPDMNSFKKVEELKHYADGAAKACTVRSVPPISNSGASLKLIAARDIYEYETVLSEESLLQVVTKAPANADGLLCDCCAAVMVTSEEARAKTLSRENWSVEGSVRSRTISPTEPDISFSEQGPTSVEDSFYYKPQERPLEAVKHARNEEPSEEPSEGPDFSSYSFSSYEPSQNPRDIASEALASINDGKGNQKTEKTDFCCCRHCFEAPFCDTECFQKSVDYHDHLCMTGIEDEIRSACCQAMEALSKSMDNGAANGAASKAVNEAANELFIHPKKRCLYDLLLVRILAIAACCGENPLNLKEIRWLNGDLRPCSIINTSRMRKDLQNYPSTTTESPNTKLLPWTFTNNVLRPLQYMKEIGFDRRFVHLRNYDGWVINTLYAKIMHSTRITEGVRHAKVYDDLGKLETKLMAPPQERISRNVIDKDIWVGSLHPIFAMIGIVDEAKGEKANVSLKDGGVVTCYPVPCDNEEGEDTAMEIDDPDEEMTGTTRPRSAEDDGWKISIRAGDAILRAKGSKGVVELA